MARFWNRQLSMAAGAALALGGMIDVFAQAVYNYPTLSDMYKVAALDGLEKWDWHQKKQRPA